MKTRLDYVTNSSSSSYVILGKEVKLKEIILNNNTEDKFVMCGRYLSDGNDIITLNNEYLEHLKSSESENKNVYYDCAFYKVFEEVHEYEEGLTKEKLQKIIDKLKPNEKLGVFSFDADYHSTENISDFIERY